MSTPRFRYQLFGAATLVLFFAACGKTSIEAEPGVDAGPKPDAGPLTCPPGLPGAKLVLLRTASGGAYCIDQREVTKGEYASFLAQVDAKAPVQPPECAWNDRFSPVLYDPYDPNWDGNSGPGTCDVQSWQLDAQADHAVVCVDFCDAWAYCQAAGKRLCGIQGSNASKVNLQADPSAADQLKASAQNEWYDACSSGGKFKFPYGDSYAAGTCVDETALKNKGQAALDVAKVGSDACHGVGAGYEEVYDSSGDVWEWINVCAGPGCLISGGAWKVFQVSDLQCDAAGLTTMRQTDAVTGFRCCADPIP